jgi:hypothetical protein
LDGERSVRNEQCNALFLCFVVIRRTGGKQNTQQFARFLRIHGPDPWIEPIKLVSAAFNHDGKTPSQPETEKSRDGPSICIDLVSQALPQPERTELKAMLNCPGFQPFRE